MSKVNAMQAMREARYAARASVTAPPVPPRPARGDASAPAVEPRLRAAERNIPNSDSEATAQVEAATAAAPEEALCGHRSMNNRICKRPAGHAEKNHRYN